MAISNILRNVTKSTLLAVDRCITANKSTYNLKLLGRYLERSGFESSEIKDLYKLLKFPQKEIINASVYGRVFDKIKGESRYLKPKEVSEILKAQPELELNVFEQIMALPASSMNPKELLKIFKDKKLMQKLKARINPAEFSKMLKELKTVPMAKAENIGSIKKGTPRYIYHLTNKKNYEAMLKDGVLKPSKDINFEGVFAIELPNFFKQWCKAEENGQISLANKLLLQIEKIENEIVMLKIPTAKLNPENLFVRSQDTYFGIMKQMQSFGYEFFQTFQKTRKKNGDVHTAIINTIDKFSSKEAAEHLSARTRANMAPYYKRNKERIEYIYRDCIPMDIVEKIGQAQMPNDRFNCNIKEVFTNLLEGQPEQKGALLLKG